VLECNCGKKEWSEIQTEEGTNGVLKTELNDLQPETLVEARVYAFNKFGKGQLTKVVTSKTPDGRPTALDPPDVVAKSATLIKISFSHNSGEEKKEPSKKSVQYRDTRSDDWTDVTDITEESEDRFVTILQNLQPDTQYYIRVVLTNKYGSTLCKPTNPVLTPDGTVRRLFFSQNLLLIIKKESQTNLKNFTI